jgi:signal transduction histidine kinase
MAMQQQLDLVHKMIERKLAAARITGDMLPAAQLAIPKDFDSLIQTLHRVHHQRYIQCTIVNPQQISRIPIHREDGMELFGNLLDNAFKWANTQVRISIGYTDSEAILLQVEDDGIGVEPAQMASLTTRGSRLDEATVGHGLGLSIVKEICDQYGFVLQFSRSETLKGLSVSILINQ